MFLEFNLIPHCSQMQVLNPRRPVIFIDTGLYIILFSSFILKDIENGITNMNISLPLRYAACLRGKGSQNCK